MNRKKVQRLIHVLVGVVSYIFVAYRIAKIDFASFPDVLSGAFNSVNIVHFFLVVLLMFGVWAVETKKWVIATRKFSGHSFVQCWKAVWYGLVVGQFTPNRIGEPLGRIAFIEAENRGKALVASVWCSFTQQLATLLFGAIGLYVWIFGFNLDLVNYKKMVVVLFLLGWAVLLAFFMFRFKWVLTKLERSRIVTRMLHSERLEFMLSGFDATNILLLSVLKYFIFSTQYVILLRVFGVDAPIFSLYIAVMLNYLFITFVPSIAATELGVRLGAAIGFIGMLSPNIGGVAAAASMLWICNIGIPVLLSVWMRVPLQPQPLTKK